jgi:predicted RecB family nuclease
MAEERDISVLKLNKFTEDTLRAWGINTVEELLKQNLKDNQDMVKENFDKLEQILFNYLANK